MINKHYRRKRKAKTPPRWTITRRWVINNLGLITLVLLVLDFASLYVIQNYYYGASQQYLNTKISSVTGVLSRYAQDADTSFSSEMRSTIENFSDKEKMELMAINSKGQVVLTSSGFTPEENAAMPDYESAMDGGDGYWVGTVGKETVMAVTVDISDLSTEYNAIRVVASLEQVKETLHTYIFGVTAICVGILLLLVITGVYFIRSIVQPIQQINATTKKFAKGDFSVRINDTSNDEIGDLCVSINQMADELSNTENMKNEFISSVSHELRTPLTAIKGWAETMCMEADPDTVQRGVHVIVNETERLSEMVEELLDFSRMQSGRFSLQCATMDVLAELGDAVLIYMEKAKRENIRIIYQEPEMLPFVYGDKNRIRQVFINVIDNAIKYSNPGSTITVSAEEVSGMIQVTITDNGVGISAADLPRVKTKFFKANHTRRGSGIGLAVADEIITMHGGRLDITSELNVGTNVTITLPIESQRRSSAAT
ncbi:sensor histidine kinase [Ruminococcus sp.]|jgi:signal transduction histidine kinase|uniref:sensor histidine kinase n=1 Tax=Ruminococcus sp. TaxID=41978 RepID=UPI0026388B9F|nr:HAMP domain-containing sensor histidine kinase [Ruminococcus sp.]MEE0022082.1 HAMP domain-containing sensor histidine kinase [Ruminococcus sp.]